MGPFSGTHGGASRVRIREWRQRSDVSPAVNRISRSGTLGTAYLCPSSVRELAPRSNVCQQKRPSLSAQNRWAALLLSAGVMDHGPHSQSAGPEFESLAARSFRHVASSTLAPPVRFTSGTLVEQSPLRSTPS